MNLKEFTKNLIEHRTVTGNQEEIEDAFRQIETRLSDEFEIVEFCKEGVKSLLIYPRGTEEIKVLLHGHLDVVNADDKLFKPEVEEGKIYGRGSADMKAGVACNVKLMQECGYQGLGLLITSDEEKGGFNGTGYVLEEKNLRPDLVISAEPDDSGEFPSIVNRQKGVLQLKISAEGCSAHASKPEKGENAADELIKIYREEIRPLFESEKDFRTTVNLGKINAGDMVNRVPDHAEMELDIRYSQDYPKNQVLEDLRGIEGLNIEVTAEAPMMYTESGSRTIMALVESVNEVSNKIPEMRDEAFASDMRFFTAMDVPAVCFGPEGYNLHGENEYVDIDSMGTYCEILKNFLESELN